MHTTHAWALYYHEELCNMYARCDLVNTKITAKLATTKKNLSWTFQPLKLCSQAIALSHVWVNRATLHHDSDTENNFHFLFVTWHQRHAKGEQTCGRRSQVSQPAGNTISSVPLFFDLLPHVCTARSAVCRCLMINVRKIVFFLLKTFHREVNVSWMWTLPKGPKKIWFFFRGVNRVVPRVI